MPEPRTAEEWALEADGYLFCVPCREEHGRKRPAVVGPALYFRYESCPDCRRAHITHCLKVYARQQVEADRAQTVEFLEVEARHKDWKPVLAMFKRLIEVIRALPVETP